MSRDVANRPNPQAPPAPEPLAVPVLDSHTHVDLQEASIDETLAAAASVRVDRIVQVGVDVSSSQWGAGIAEKYDAVLATVAIHPNEAPQLGSGLAAAVAEIERLAGLPHVRGIGETGLDHFRTGPEGRKEQEESFRAHVQMARQHNKALMIHDRDAHDEVLRVLDSEGAPEKVIFHCFSGDEDFARRCVDQDYVLSFAGNITFKNAESLRAAARVVPREQLLVETDGPFLTPMPYRGQPNAPCLIPIIVRFLAELRGEDLDELCAAIWANGQRIFGN